MNQGPFRLAIGGRIDRSQPLGFSLDGRQMSGFQGDTLASALLANGVSLIGRSFKYHRPRGFLSAGVDEPNGLFTLGDGARTEPNIPGTTVELVAGLMARCQNAWPSVAFDLRAINSLAAPLLSAGFYYKTFMGPTRGAWMFYERFIRRAAGLGRAVYERDPDRYESRHACTDVLVIGAGPAGLVAALTAARSGARVVLVEQDSLLGGALLRQRATETVVSWLRDIEEELKSLPQVEILRRTTAAGLYDGGTVALVERREHLKPDASRGEARQIFITLRARAIVFATGALERPLIFPNNDRPGVMLASAVRSYLNRFAVSPGRRALIVTNNSSAYAAAADIARLGVAVTLADVRRLVDPALTTMAEISAIELIQGATVLDVHGSKAVKKVILVGRESSARTLDCDFIGMSGGWSPTVHLTSHGGIKALYREDIAAFVPGGYAAGQFGAGALTGSFSTAAAFAEGSHAGKSAAAYVGRTARIRDVPQPPDENMHYAIESAWHVPQRRGKKAFVDFQNDVTVGDLAIAHQEGYRAVELLKRYTTLGMGTDQGKTSNLSAHGLMAALGSGEVPVAGTTTFRPPFTPITIGALAGRAIGHHFRPIRRSPLHAWHMAHGCEMIEAGLWMRPWYYQWAGESAESAYLEEMRKVRTGVGLSDISTLGKIDVQGPDAAEFLDRVYVNVFSTLPIGKARYGVMLNDDGSVLDDGTTTRLSKTGYFMTTTTAQAAEVMSWLEFLLQTSWPDLKVHVTSVTDEWAGMAVAGPQARAALERALPGQDLSDAHLPYLGCLEISFHGVPVRVIRLSFSGELAFEVYVPADQGIAFWEHLLAQAAPLDIRPYGLEALASLRIEKGHVAGLELDHRNTLRDLGLAKMASRQKAFVGRELAERPQLQSPDRWSLVGIECVDEGQRLRGGAILFASSDPVAGHGRGYITSVTWSTELHKYIALGLYQGGLQYLGQEIVCAFPLKDEKVRARIVSPIFIDPTGGRLRA